MSSWDGPRWATCRFCKEIVWSTEEIHYGPRHSAHPRCYLQRKGLIGLERLHLWQLEKFPVLVARQFGLLDELVRLIENHPEKAPQ